MKKLFFSLFVGALVFASCSSEDSASPGNTNFSNSPVSGVIYGESFTIGGGYARPISLNGVASYYIYMDTASVECFESSGTPLWVILPAGVGTYDSTQVSVQFRNDDGSFEGASEEKVEITEVTETTVKGKIRAVGFDDTEHYINGTFAVQYCPL